MRVDLYKILLAAAVASWPLAASAQNLDPTVEVNRSYEGKLIEVNKPMLEMAVPDSVLRFDLEFDYEVFDNPYKGAYEFKPYTMQLQPVGQASQQQRLYMKLGAGKRPGGAQPSSYCRLRVVSCPEGKVQDGCICQPQVVCGRIPFGGSA